MQRANTSIVAGMAPGVLAGSRRTYKEVADLGNWRPIPHCPGRSVWRGGAEVTLRDLVGPAVPVEVFEVAGARHPVHVGLLDGGGIISYRHPDGRFVHTLNTTEGLTRKLAELGIEVG